MKKNVFVAVFLLSASTITFAQLNFGVKLGYTSSLSLSNLGSVSNGSYNLNSVQGEMWNNFHGGLFARVGLGKSIYIQPELLYAIGTKNYQLTPKNATNGVSMDKFITISTVDVPLLVGYKLLDLKLINLRAFAGPKLRLNAGSPLAFENTATVGGTPSDKLEATVKASQLGLEAGVGVDVLMFTLDARYNLIGDMYTTKINSLSLSDIPMSTFVISLGWKFL